LLTSGIVLSLVGFDQSIDQQSMETLTNLRIADILIPIITASMAIILVWKYDITETKANEIRAALIIRRGKIKHQGENGN
jgi:GPH family glycoside/pentoside/hexuronide:cation symporter